MFPMLFCSISAHVSEFQLVCDGPTDRPIDRQTDRPTDRPTDTVAYRSRARDKKMKTGVVYIGILASVFILIIYSFAYRSKAIE